MQKAKEVQAQAQALEDEHLAWSLEAESWDGNNA